MLSDGKQHVMEGGQATYECDQVIDQHKNEAHDGKVKEVPPASEIRFQPKLVVDAQNANRDQVRQGDSTKYHEDILGYEAPRGVAGS